MNKKKPLHPVFKNIPLAIKINKAKKPLHPVFNAVLLAIKINKTNLWGNYGIRNWTSQDKYAFL